MSNHTVVTTSPLNHPHHNIFERLASTLLTTFGVRTEVVLRPETSATSDKELIRAASSQEVEYITRKKFREAKILELQELLLSLESESTDLSRCMYQLKRNTPAKSVVHLNIEIELIDLIISKVAIIHDLAQLDNAFVFTTCAIHFSQGWATHYLADYLEDRRFILEAKEICERGFQGAKMKLHRRFEEIRRSSFYDFVKEHEKVVFAQKPPSDLMPRRTKKAKKHGKKTKK